MRTPGLICSLRDVSARSGVTDHSVGDHNVNSEYQCLGRLQGGIQSSSSWKWGQADRPSAIWRLKDEEDGCTAVLNIFSSRNSSFWSSAYTHSSAAWQWRKGAHALTAFISWKQHIWPFSSFNGLNSFDFLLYTQFSCLSPGEIPDFSGVSSFLCILTPSTCL